MRRKVVHMLPPDTPVIASKPVDSLWYPPRGMSRDEAARYIGVGVTKFEEMVAAREMPKPKAIGKRRVWDRVQLDIYFTGLPEADERRDSLEKFLQATRKPKP